jgi:hypothetical protein
MNIFQEIIDWSEAWALLIPLTFYFIWKPKYPWVKPVIIYLVIAFVLNLTADMIWKKGLPFIELPIRDAFTFLYVPEYKQVSNNLFYNLHSIIRLILFTWFFYKLEPVFFKKLNLFVVPAFILFSIINFTFFANIIILPNSALFAVEAAILLLYCILYFIRLNKDDRLANPFSESSFKTVSGLTLYNAINFPIFIFYDYLIISNDTYSEDIWTVHNITYVVLNILIAFSFKK